MYYTDRVLPAVQERVERENAQGPCINIIREVTKEMFEKENPETIAAVNAALAAAKERDLDGNDGASGLSRTPEQYQRYGHLFIVA